MQARTVIIRRVGNAVAGPRPFTLRLRRRSAAALLASWSSAACCSARRFGDVCGSTEKASGHMEIYDHAVIATVVAVFTISALLVIDLLTTPTMW
jgi:hypothetical protein